MSVLLDAVNNFGPTHPFSYHNAPQAHDSEPPPPKRSRTPAAHMSASAQRASSSSSSSSSAQQQHVPTQDPSRTSAHGADESATQPPEPALAARTAPPAEGESTPTIEAADRRQGRPSKIKVRDLEHIQSFATEDMGAFSEIKSRSRSGSRSTQDEAPQYEISDMKVEHIIEMVAGLLTKITSTNDAQHRHIHGHAPQLDGATHLNPQTSSVLAFHGKNVPSITILSYLSRINKYCPTSYEVFLSLLVYFDRMTERVNAGPMQSLRQANEAANEAAMEQDKDGSSSSDSLASDPMEGVTATTPQGTQTATPPHSGGLEKGLQQGRPGTPHSRSYQDDSPSIPPELGAEPYNLSHFFVVDSFNIHRLVIAGVTCASKFFSDIFYTNSRYAKVGGLPLPELNHLELQFLLLNDFRLSIPVEEIEAYGTMLVEFYAREVVAQQRAAQEQAMQARSLSESSSERMLIVGGGAGKVKKKKKRHNPPRTHKPSLPGTHCPKSTPTPIHYDDTTAFDAPTSLHPNTRNCC